MTPEEHQKQLDEARKYINSAPTPEQRSMRKQEMYYILYRNTQSLADWLKEKSNA